MLSPRPRFDAWADLAKLDPQGLAALLDWPSAVDLLDRLQALTLRLPSGLLCAEAVHIQPRAISDGAPLAPGSPWYAAGAELIGIVDLADADALDDMLGDLIEYAEISRRLHRAAIAEPKLREAVQSTEADPHVLRLAAALGTPVERWLRLESISLRQDIAQMFDAPFEAPIHLHPHTRPGWLADAGRDLADRLRAMCPSERPWILATEGPEAVDLLSPYIRDLTGALGQWAVENPEQVRTPGLRDAWAEDPHDDLAALVVQDLMHFHDELVEERRANERGQGLFVVDEGGLQAGYAELSRLAAPDRVAVPSGSRGAVLIAAGGPRPMWTAAVEHWLKDGRVAGVSAVFASSALGTQPLLPEVVADDADAFVLPGTPTLMADAEATSLNVVATEALRLPGRCVSPVCRLLGQLRKAQLVGKSDADTPIFVAFAPGHSRGLSRTLEGGRARIEAARLVMRRASLSILEPISGPGHTTKSTGNTGPARRFRA